MPLSPSLICEQLKRMIKQPAPTSNPIMQEQIHEYFEPPHCNGRSTQTMAGMSIVRRAGDISGMAKCHLIDDIQTETRYSILESR